MESSDTRSIANLILEKAICGTPRMRFIEEVFGLLAGYSRCDNIRMVLLDRGRRYRIRAERGKNDKPGVTGFRFDVTNQSDIKKAKKIWATAPDSALELLCREIITREIDTDLPHFTDFGSFRARDVDTVDISGLQKFPANGHLGLKINEKTRSFLLVPIELGHERIGLVEMEYRRKRGFNSKKTDALERLIGTFGLALAQRGLQTSLREREKELTCLYRIAKIAARPAVLLEEVLQETVRVLPDGWFYPEIAEARIVVDGSEFTTDRFGDTVQNMTGAISVDGRERGFVEIGYRVKCSPLDEGPFLLEERNLIDTVADEIAVIIEQKRAEGEKMRLQEQLRHADRLATIGQMAAGVAHELNEPLANILGFAQLSSKDEGISHQARQDIDKIVKASLHARSIIKRLLIFARETTQVRHSVNLNELIEDGLYLLESRCQKDGIELVRRLDEHLPVISGDRSQLLQVLTNLVVNAIQAIPDGGRLVISTESKNDGIVLAVRDSGIGMTPETVKKIFNPFYTTKTVDQGTGLGLSVVQGIVNTHGGKIDIESEPGKGSCFYVRLPLIPPDSSSEGVIYGG